jgi:hypothetical protein
MDFKRSTVLCAQTQTKKIDKAALRATLSKNPRHPLIRIIPD